MQCLFSVHWTHLPMSFLQAGVSDDTLLQSGSVLQALPTHLSPKVVMVANSPAPQQSAQKVV